MRIDKQILHDPNETHELSNEIVQLASQQLHLAKMLSNRDTLATKLNDVKRDYFAQTGHSDVSAKQLINFMVQQAPVYTNTNKLINDFKAQFPIDEAKLQQSLNELEDTHFNPSAELTNRVTLATITNAIDAPGGISLETFNDSEQAYYLQDIVQTYGKTTPDTLDEEDMTQFEKVQQRWAFVAETIVDGSNEVEMPKNYMRVMGEQLRHSALIKHMLNRSDKECMQVVDKAVEFAKQLKSGSALPTQYRNTNVDTNDVYDVLFNKRNFKLFARLAPNALDGMLVNERKYRKVYEQKGFDERQSLVLGVTRNYINEHKHLAQTPFMKYMPERTPAHLSKDEKVHAAVFATAGAMVKFERASFEAFRFNQIHHNFPIQQQDKWFINKALCALSKNIAATMDPCKDFIKHTSKELNRMFSACKSKLIAATVAVSAALSGCSETNINTELTNTTSNSSAYTQDALTYIDSSLKTGMVQQGLDETLAGRAQAKEYLSQYIMCESFNESDSTVEQCKQNAVNNLRSELGLKPTFINEQAIDEPFEYESVQGALKYSLHHCKEELSESSAKNNCFDAIMSLANEYIEQQAPNQAMNTDKKVAMTI